MKRIYEAPAIEVIEMELEDVVLQTSGTYDSLDPNSTVFEDLTSGSTLGY